MNYAFHNCPSMLNAFLILQWQELDQAMAGALDDVDAALGLASVLGEFDGADLSLSLLRYDDTRHVCTAYTHV
jgi:hypothetical protein